MSDIGNQLEGIIGRLRLHDNEHLAKHSIKKIEAIAKWYIEVEKEEELVVLVTKAHELQLPVYIMGSGSSINLLQREIEGLVIKNNCRKFDKMGMRGTIKESKLGMREVLISAEAGVNINQLVRYTIDEGLSGLEYQLGLPGTVGGALVTNAGYNQKKVRETLQSVRVLQSDGSVRLLTTLPLFPKRGEPCRQTKDVILSAVFKMLPEKKEVLWERGNEALLFRREYSKTQGIHQKTSDLSLMEEVLNG